MTLSVTYAKLIDSMASGLVDFTSDNFKAMLLSSYTVGSTDTTAQFLSDVLAAATEASGTGYTAGGKLLTGVDWSQSGSTWTLTCDDIAWASSSVAAAYAVFYDSTPSTNATRPVLGYWDFGGTLTSTASTFNLNVNASGLLTFTAV